MSCVSCVGIRLKPLDSVSDCFVWFRLRNCHYCTCARLHSIDNPPEKLVSELWSLADGTSAWPEPLWPPRTAAATRMSAQGDKTMWGVNSHRTKSDMMPVDSNVPNSLSENNQHVEMSDTQVWPLFRDKQKPKKFSGLKANLPSPLSSCVEWRCGSLTSVVSCIVQMPPWPKPAAPEWRGPTDALNTLSVQAFSHGSCVFDDFIQ